MNVNERERQRSAHMNVQQQGGRQQGEEQRIKKKKKTMTLLRHGLFAGEARAKNKKRIHRK